MSIHTPHVRVNPPDSPDGDFQLQSEPYGEMGDRGHTEVIGYASWEDSPVTRAEAEANAYLWAAAPDLLKACKRANQLCSMPKDIRKMLVAAIAKAERHGGGG